VKQLEKFQQRQIRRMLGIHWDDFVSNVEVLERTGLAPIKALIEKSQLRWPGHNRRMDEKEFPKIVLYGQEETAAPVGRKRGIKTTFAPCLQKQTRRQTGNS
jgi:hypothetical protein